MLNRIVSFLAAALTVAYAFPQARQYATMAFTVLGAFYAIVTVLMQLPGRVGAFFGALAHDLESALAQLPKPPASGNQPKPPGVGAGTLSALCLAAVVALAGCAGALPVVETVITDSICILSDFDALAAAEQAGPVVFIAECLKIAVKCGVPTADVVKAYGTEKASRVARAAKAASAKVPQ